MLTGEALGAAIETARVAKGVSKAEMARHFGVRPPSIQGLQPGETLVHPVTGFQVCSVHSIDDSAMVSSPRSVRRRSDGLCLILGIAY